MASVRFAEDQAFRFICRGAFYSVATAFFFEGKDGDTIMQYLYPDGQCPV